MCCEKRNVLLRTDYLNELYIFDAMHNRKSFSTINTFIYMFTYFPLHITDFY